MQRIFIPVVGLMFLLQAVGSWPQTLHSEQAPAQDEPEEDRDWLYHSAPDTPQHQLQWHTLVLDESPMNEPEEDRDMIYHGSSNIPHLDVLPRMTQLDEDSSLDRVVRAERERGLKMIVPPDPLNEPEEDRDMIYHSVPSHPHHQGQAARVVLVEEVMNEPEEDRDMIHHGM
ncbi:uncharacterized protein LOC144609994 [Rhinoraja longicauda]